MEALGITASVVAIVTIGLQCSKFIYQIVSGIKDGPSAVQKVVKAAKTLMNLLEQIKELALHAENVLGAKNSKFFEEFRPLLSEGVEELTVIKEELSRFTASSDHRLWYNLKTYLREKDFEKICDRIEYYTQLFTSQLSCAGAILGLLNIESIQLVGSAISAVSWDTGQRFDNLEMVWNKNTSQVNANHRKITSELERQRDKAEAMAGHHFKMLDGLSSSLKQKKASDRGMRKTLDKVSGQSDGLLSMSAAQFSEIQELVATVRDLRLEMQGMRDDQAQWRQGKDIGVKGLDLAPSREEILDDKGYDESIIRLCDLAVGTERETSSREAQSIIHDLKQIIASLLNAIISPAQTLYTLKSNQHDEVKYDKYKEEIERQDAIHRIRDILGASRRLRLYRQALESGAPEDLKTLSLANQLGVSKRRRLFKEGKTSDAGIGHDSVTMYSPELIRHTKSVDRMADTFFLRKRRGKIGLRNSSNPAPRYQENSVAFTQIQDPVSLSELEPFFAESIIKLDSFSWQTAAGLFDIQYYEQFLRHRNQPDLETDEAIQEEEFSARVVYTPPSTTTPTSQLILNLSQRLTNGKNILSIPALSFRSIVPNNSAVFRIVQHGSIYELQKAISEGSASLGDCDSKGRPLLNYAMRALRPTMARFLIEAGADVNSYEVDELGDTRAPFNWLFCNDHENSSRKRYLKTACLRMLLSNDADPSVMVNCCGKRRFNTAFYCEMRSCSTASLRAFLNLGSPFIGPNSTGETQADPRKKYPLLGLCVIHRDGTARAFETAEKMALLLSRGADVNQRDSSGNTCLHIVMDYSPLALQNNNLERQNELRDILTLMVTSGADICAINNAKQTVLDIANHFGHHKIWTEILDTCGFGDPNVRQSHNADYGWSSAVDQSDSRRPAEGTLKLSFLEYLDQRKRDARCRVVEEFEYVNAEEEHVRELCMEASDYEVREEDQDNGKGGWN